MLTTEYYLSRQNNTNSKDYHNIMLHIKVVLVLEKYAQVILGALSYQEYSQKKTERKSKRNPKLNQLRL